VMLISPPPFFFRFDIISYINMTYKEAPWRTKVNREKYQFNFMFLNVLLKLVHCTRPFTVAKSRHHRLFSVDGLFIARHSRTCSHITKFDEPIRGINSNKTIFKKTTEQCIA
jgi:hypothetical protein